jgi:enoyl-[acyl-carrier protein] reductase III
VLTEALTHFASFRENDDLVERVLARTPAGRLCTPEDVADVVTFLCSPAAKTICGQTIVMDGGHSLLIQ